MLCKLCQVTKHNQWWFGKWTQVWNITGIIQCLNAFSSRAWRRVFLWRRRHMVKSLSGSSLSGYKCRISLKSLFLNQHLPEGRVYKKVEKYGFWSLWILFSLHYPLWPPLTKDHTFLCNLTWSNIIQSDSIGRDFCSFWRLVTLWHHLPLCQDQQVARVDNKQLYET